MCDTPPHGPMLMNKRDAADYIGISLDTFEKYVRAGFFPVVRLGGKRTSRLLFRRADVDVFVAAATTPATSGPLTKKS